MSRLLPAVLLLVLLFPAFARAERVMEVQNIRVEQPGSAGRDAAFATATRMAAAQVWARLGRSTPLPELSPERLQAMTSYVDVANETVQPNYYAGNFSVGIRVSALLDGTTAGEDGAEASPALQGPAAEAADSTGPAPAWILVVPAREVGGSVSLWTAGDPWSQAWQRAAGGPVATAVASGDTDDQRLLTAGQIQSYDPGLGNGLQALARKYKAPALALVLLDSQREQPMVGEEIRIEVSYIEADSTEQLTAQGSVFISAVNAASPMAAALAEGQRLLTRLATGQGETGDIAASPATTAPVAVPAGQPGLSSQFANTYTGTAAPGGVEQKLWIRIPLKTPMDLANYRKQIEAIPGARLQIVALNRMYVEGNILYSGSEAQLLAQLAERGLRQQ